MFAAIGCATFHTPALQTGPSGNPLFHHVPVRLFSDLLMHDIGTGDDIAQSVVAPEEIRTPAIAAVT
ncbi:MAG TPA: di-heme oxidoredictase family protein, partial [Vicinamibacterales bacterium]|nr:di-heme oxidoredictase family protein [Vicinamibacterales bacterium]